ncbi:MAG: TonB-dependent receptor [Bacteroidota bacterium]
MKKNYFTLFISIFISHFAYQTIYAKNNATDSLALLNDTTANKEILLNKEVVIIGSRYQKNAFDHYKSIATLNKQQLQWLSAMSTPDVLAEISGVWMQKTNHGGGSPFIRGLTGYQTLLMIDGIRLNNSTFRSGPNQYLNTIDPWTLERIEVLRGQGAVAYGTDAIGGTALLLSKDPKFIGNGYQFSGNVYAKYMTSNMERSGRAEVILEGERIALLGGITSRNLGDIKAGGDLGTLEQTGYDEMDWDLKLKFKVTNNAVLTLAHQHVKQKDVPLYHKLVTDEYSTYSFDPQQRDLAYARLQTFHKSQIFSEIVYTTSWQRSIEQRKKQKTNNPELSTERDEVNTLGATVEIISEISDKWKASSGIEFYHDEVQSTTQIFNEESNELQNERGLYPQDASTSNIAVYSLHQYDFGKLNFSAGVRWNYFQLSLRDAQFGSTKIEPSALVGNIGMSYSLHPKHRIVASASTAFRAPNINDVSSFGIADFRYEVPNYNLKPEQSFNVEIGYKVKTNRLSGALHLFRNKLTNLITNTRSTFNGQTEIDDYQVYRRENSNEAILKGFESELEWALTEKLVTYGNLVYTHGQDLNKDEPMRRIPPLNGRLGLRYGLNSLWYVKGDFVFAATQDRLSSGDIDDNRIAVGGTSSWQTFNLSGGIDLPLLTINAGLQNIFNEAYRTHGSGIDGIGRSLWISVTAKF